MSLKMLTIALLLGPSAAFAGQLAEVPKDMQDIWCGPRLRVGGVPKGNCIRLGPKSISVEGRWSPPRPRPVTLDPKASPPLLPGLFGRSRAAGTRP